MVKGKTSSGFSFALNENVINNMELVDALAESEDDPTAISRVCRMLLGDELRKKLYSCLRDENGSVPIDKVSEALIEIFAAFGKAGKN